MKTVLAAVLLVSLCVALMCIGILVKGRFPETEISRNEQLRRRGIRCYKEEDALLHAPKHKTRTACGGTMDESCEGCSFYESEKVTKE